MKKLKDASKALKTGTATEDDKHEIKTILDTIKQ